MSLLRIVEQYVRALLCVRGRQTDRQTDRKTDRQTDRQAGRQADRQTDKERVIVCVCCICLQSYFRE
jgi:hypothetical protein